MATVADAGEILLSPDFIEDPYHRLAELRVVAPVLWSGAVGGWVLTRYDDVVVTFKDTDTYGNAGRMTRVLNHLDTKLAKAAPVLPLVQPAIRAFFRSNLHGVSFGGSNFEVQEASEDW